MSHGPILILIASAALTVRAYGLDPQKAITQYHQDFWSEEEGLPQASVQAIVQTRKGYIWVGTRDGLARFDGNKFTIYRSDQIPGLLSDDIRSLYEDNLGRLWIGTFNGGVSCLDNGVFRAYGAADGIPSKGILDIYQDSSGNLWFGGWRGIVRLNGPRFEAYSEDEGVEGKSGWSFCEDQHHRLWAATERAIHVYTGSRFQVQDSFGGVPASNIRKILVDRKGRFWIGTLNGLIQVDHGQGKLFTVADGLADNRVRALAEDTHGNIWVGTWEGLSRIQGNQVSSCPTRYGERLSGMIEALSVDSDGSLWIGMRGGGLARLRDAKFSNFTTREGLPSKLPRCVYEARDGAIWIGTDGGGLVRLEGDRVQQHLTRSNGLPSDFVATIAEGKDGTIWAGLGRPAAVAALRGARVEEVLNSSQGLPSEYSVRALFVDRDGVLWAGGDGGLCRIISGRIHVIPGLPSPPVRVIAQDAEGRMWIGTDGGLCLLKGEELVSVFTSQNGLSHTSVYAFHQDTSGTIWLGTQRGLTRFKAGRFELLPKTKGAFHGTIYQVLEAEDETLWTSSSRGISAMKKNLLNALLDGAVPTLETTTFGTADGLASTQCQGGSQSPGCRTRDGRLWFATLNGVAVIQPGIADPHKEAPPVLIEEIWANRVAASPQEEHRFPADTDAFEFHYTALKFITPEKVQFRYQLAGHDKQWILAGSRRTAYYNNLKPGSYTFRVSASSDGSIWSRPVESAPFVLRPHFYQTPWFYWFCTGTVGACAWAFHRSRLRKEKERFALVLAERSRIARDLHDTMAQGFAGTAFQLEALRSHLSMQPPETKRHLDLALMMVRHSFAEARRAVLNLRSPGLQNGSLVSAVTEAGRQMLADTGMELVVNSHGKPPLLDADTEQQLLRICQEALANVIKHANATRIELSFDFVKERPFISIRDNGSGFDLEETSKVNGFHLGLLGMRERIKQVGGHLEIKTSPGRGTEILVDLN